MQVLPPGNVPAVKHLKPLSSASPIELYEKNWIFILSLPYLISHLMIFMNKPTNITLPSNWALKTVIADKSLLP